MIFKIDIVKFHWINGDLDDQKDLCLHGNVIITFGNEIIDDGLVNSWTISGGAFRMLRSLYEDHLAGQEEHLMPCCGHFMFINENKLSIAGCKNGIDWSVIHQNEEICLTTEKGNHFIIPSSEYKTTVFRFADAISDFYESCKPKVFTDNYDKQMYTAFWNEWRDLRYKSVLNGSKDYI